MADFLLELFSEEIPSRFQVEAENQLEAWFKTFFQENKLTYHTLEVASTPRRLVVMAHDLSPYGAEQHIEKRGPRVGSPDEVIKKFAASMQLQPHQLVQDKGYWFARQTLAGQPTTDLLKASLPQLIQNFSWPKSMVWEEREFTWVRPLRGILALLGDQVIPFKIGHLTAGHTTHGHRLWGQEPLTIHTLDHYRSTLAQHGVMLHRRDRAEVIQRQIHDLCQKEGLVYQDQQDLFEEVVGLVEHPVVYLGRIPASFMDLPVALLKTVMSHHQRYFATYRPDGSLAPYFLCVANIHAPDQGTTMMRGYERVLNARLADARFFYDQDRKSSLFSCADDPAVREQRAKALQKMVFTRELGTMLDKAKRIQALARILGEEWPVQLQDPQVQDLAFFLKADLCSEMVKEFPEVQGIMGAEYARHQGASPIMAQAIEEHLRPQGDQSPLPTSPLGALMALADKLDTLVGFFGLGRIPTGSKDPFALRRAALGIVRISWAFQDYAWPFKRALHEAYQNYSFISGVTLPVSSQEVAKTLGLFVKERLTKTLFSAYDPHLVDAVMQAEAEYSLKRIALWIQTLQTWHATPEGETFKAAYRRVDHILKAEEAKEGPYRFSVHPNPELMDPATEWVLAQACEKMPLNPTPQEAIAHWQGLTPLIQKFFDTHRINDDRPHYRLNRLQLLQVVRQSIKPYVAYDRIP